MVPGFAAAVGELLSALRARGGYPVARGPTVRASPPFPAMGASGGQVRAGQPAHRRVGRHGSTRVLHPGRAANSAATADPAGTADAACSARVARTAAANSASPEVAQLWEASLKQTSQRPESLSRCIGTIVSRLPRLAITSKRAVPLSCEASTPFTFSVANDRT